MYELIQTTILDVPDDETLAIILDNFRNPKLGGWKNEEIDLLEKNKMVERVGKISTGNLAETIRIVPKFKLVGV